ncbi:MAG: alpha-amylase family glycosyl hydrolase [Pseudomonadota bacterium]
MNAGPKVEWWRGATLYQIYPRSFLDSTGDGVGDLQGITGKLDYVASLGVDGIWLSPFFRSPMKDYGYDVSDYLDVDPIFGTLADFDELVRRAHELDLKVVIDQVYSHTSDEHAWFQESRQSRDNPKADWYVWADAKEDGSPPTNWLSVFGGPAWTWDARREQYYLHNFLAGQPDLNLYSADVQAALHEVARFWLDRGVDGFRLDAINFGMHDRDLRDNPPSVAPFRNLSRPFLMQDQRYNLSQPDMPQALENLRRMLDTYGDVFTVAEIGGAVPLPTMREYTLGDSRLNTAYGFEFLGLPKLTVEDVARILRAWPNGHDDGWPSWAFSNHDVSRAMSRWLDGVDHERRAALLLLLLVSLRGNIFVYQGEELGLPQAEIPFEQLRDPEAIANWPHTAGRDGARTPMPWDSDACFAGFSTAEPWLPIDPTHTGLAVNRQESNGTSILKQSRELLKLRRNSPALRAGDLDVIEAAAGVLAFTRQLKGDEVLCAFNISDQTRSWQPPESSALQVVATVGTASPGEAPPATLAPYSGIIAMKGHG